MIGKPDWTLRDEWRPSILDTEFDIAIAVDDKPGRVRGVRRSGQDRLDPGEYHFVVVYTTSPDDKPSGTLFATIGCEAFGSVDANAATVQVSVRFALGGCDLTVQSSP